MFFRYLFAWLFLMLSGCKTPPTVQDELKLFIGQQITLPDSMRTVLRGKDTVMTDFLRADVKMVVYYDSVGCSSCQINKLHEWREAMATSFGLRHKFNVVFLFSPKSGGEADALAAMKFTRLNYPVFLDCGALFPRQNPVIPAKPVYHTFLLDSDNRVILVGNPLGNAPLWELYKNEIKKRIEK